MIEDKDVERALDYLRNSSEKAAIAKANSKVLEKYVGVIEAQQKGLQAGLSNAAAQDIARASPEYKAALEGWKEALRQDSEFTMLREAASARLEAWRTMSSNTRAMEKIR